MSDTPNLALPLLAAAQAQKHVTHNEAILVIDALLHCAVLDRDLAAPPASPAEGDRYLVASGATGSWAGQSGRIAARQGGTWSFIAPKAGFLAFVVDEGALLVFSGTAWAPATGAALQNLTRIGLGTAADAANPFSAKLNAALWTAKTAGEGGTGDLRYTLNKEGAARVLSLLFQSGYSGRAELGLVGDDDVQLKVSANGSTWVDAVRVKPDGKVGIGTASPADRLSVAGTIAPSADNAYSIGTATRRASTIYAATGTINTSDIRRKRDVIPIDPGLALAMLRATAPIAFRWDVGGSDEVDTPDGLALLARSGRRRHFGWSAQAWLAALDEAGEDAGLVVKLDRDEPDGELGIRPDQVAAVLHAAILDLAERLAALEGGSAAATAPPT